MNGRPDQWDEFQWEKFLRMQERRRETIILNTIRSKNPWRLGAMWSGIQPEPLPDEEEEFWYGETEGDDWKITSHPLYRGIVDSMEYIRSSLDQGPVRDKAPAVVVELIARSHNIPYLIAVGLTLLIEYGFSGGTVAYFKRALHLANETLHYLKEVGNERSVTPQQYAALVRECSFARNTIACSISDMRHGSLNMPFA
jgi:hypothetical protein